VGTKYSSNSTSGYNSVPPSDDGSVTEANKVKYSTIKNKLSDPVKTLADAINAELVTHFDNGPTAVTTNTTLGATHYNKVIQVSGSGVTLTLTDAATLTAGWYCDVVSTDTSNNVALARATASNTINETSADTTVYPLQSIKIMVNAAANGFLVEQKIRHVNGTNSIGKNSLYAGYGNTLGSAGPLSVGYNTGLISGYLNNPVPFLIPELKYQGKGWNGRLNIIPPVKSGDFKVDPAIGLSIGIPFK